MVSAGGHSVQRWAQAAEQLDAEASASHARPVAAPFMPREFHEPGSAMPSRQRPPPLAAPVGRLTVALAGPGQLPAMETSDLGGEAGPGAQSRMQAISVPVHPAMHCQECIAVWHCILSSIYMHTTGNVPVLSHIHMLLDVLCKILIRDRWHCCVTWTLALGPIGVYLA